MYISSGCHTPPSERWNYPAESQNSRDSRSTNENKKDQARNDTDPFTLCRSFEYESRNLIPAVFLYLIFSTITDTVSISTTDNYLDYFRLFNQCSDANLN